MKLGHIAKGNNIAEVWVGRATGILVYCGIIFFRQISIQQICVMLRLLWIPLLYLVVSISAVTKLPRHALFVFQCFRVFAWWLIRNGVFPSSKSDQEKLQEENDSGEILEYRNTSISRFIFHITANH